MVGPVVATGSKPLLTEPEGSPVMRAEEGEEGVERCVMEEVE